MPRGQSRSFLRALRKKHRLGEFRRRRKRRRGTASRASSFVRRARVSYFTGNP